MSRADAVGAGRQRRRSGGERQCGKEAVRVAASEVYLGTAGVFGVAARLSGSYEAQRAHSSRRPRSRLGMAAFGFRIVVLVEQGTPARGAYGRGGERCAEQERHGIALLDGGERAADREHEEDQDAEAAAGDALDLRRSAPPGERGEAPAEDEQPRAGRDQGNAVIRGRGGRFTLRPARWNRVPRNTVQRLSRGRAERIYRRRLLAAALAAFAARVPRRRASARVRLRGRPRDWETRRRTSSRSSGESAVQPACSHRKTTVARRRNSLHGTSRSRVSRRLGSAIAASVAIAGLGVAGARADPRRIRSFCGRCSGGAASDRVTDRRHRDRR